MLFPNDGFPLASACILIHRPFVRYKSQQKCKCWEHCNSSAGQQQIIQIDAAFFTAEKAIRTCSAQIAIRLYVIVFGLQREVRCKSLESENHSTDDSNEEIHHSFHPISVFYAYVINQVILIEAFFLYHSPSCTWYYTTTKFYSQGNSPNTVPSPRFQLDLIGIYKYEMPLHLANPQWKPVRF